jgi:hypothetical protein
MKEKEAIASVPRTMRKKIGERYVQKPGGGFKNEIKKVGPQTRTI